MTSLWEQLGRFTVEQPQWLLLLGLLPIIVYWSRRSLAALSRTKRYLAIAVRCAVILLVTAALARVQRNERSENQTVIFLLDRSQSISAAGVKQQDGWLRLATNKGKVPDQDRVAVLTFAGAVNIEQPPMKGGVYYTRAANPAGADRTDLAQAFRMALAAFPPDATRRLVLMSDGNQNVGDVRGELPALATAGVRVEVVPDLYRRSGEVLVERVVANPNVKQGEPVRVRVVLRSTAPATGSMQLFLKHDGQREEIPLSAERRRISLEPGVNVFPRAAQAPIDLALPSGGAYQIEAVFNPDPGMDETPANNRASVLVNVESKGRVLILSTDPASDQVLGDALIKEGLEAMVVAPDALPLNIATLQQFDAVFLSNVPANLVSEEAQRALRAYVYDLGGGLAMIGGDQSFGAGGWIGSPLAEALPVGLEVKHKRELPRGALAIICHACEMPEGNFWGIKTAQKAVEALSSLDWVGVITYDWQGGGESWAVKLQLAQNKERIKNDIARMSVGDMPSFTEPLELALQGLTTTAKDAGQKHIIIISDGDPGLNAKAIVPKLKAAKITVACVEVFPHTPPGQITTMMELARALKPQGQPKPSYYFINNEKDAQTLPQIFIKEARLIQRPLIRETDPPIRPILVSALPDTVAGLGRTGSLLPAIRGYVLTQKKDLTETPIVSDTKDQDPIFAHWQYGRGKTAAFTSGQWNRWGEEWAQWPQFVRFWGQTTRWLMRQSKEAGLFDISPPVIEAGRGRVAVEAVDADGSFISGDLLDLAGVVIRPDGESQPVAIQPIATGKYEAVVPLDMEGDYILNLAYTLKRADGTTRATGAVRTGLALPYSPEFRDLSSNEPLLHEIAQKGGGRYVAPNHEAVDKTNFFAHDLPPVITHLSRWRDALTLALFLFLLDVAVRRISVDWAQWYRKWAALLAILSGRRRADAREVEAVGALRQRRDQVREQLRRPEGAPDAPAPEQPAGPPLARRDQGAEPLPFEEPSGTPPIESRPGTEKPSGKEEGALAQRLRQAKERARKKMRESNQDPS